FQRGPGNPAYDCRAQNRANAALEAEFRREALDRLRRQPGVYAGNALRTFWSYNAQVSAVMLSTYERLQSAGAPAQAPQEWFRRGDPGALPLSPLALAFKGWFVVLTLLALAGAVLGARAPDPLAAVAGATYVCIGVTHALVFMHMMHYYVKVPFVTLGAVYALDRLSRTRPRPATAAAVGLSGTALVLTAWML